MHQRTANAAHKTPAEYVSVRIFAVKGKYHSTPGCIVPCFCCCLRLSRLPQYTRNTSFFGECLQPVFSIHFCGRLWCVLCYNFCGADGLPTFVGAISIRFAWNIYKLNHCYEWWLDRRCRAEYQYGLGFFIQLVGGLKNTAELFISSADNLLC